MMKRYLVNAVAGLMALCTSTAATAQSFSVGTTGQGSSGYAMTSAMARVLLERDNIRLRALPQGGPTVTLPLLNNGELDFSIAVSFVAAFGATGQEMFAEIGPLENMRVVAALRTLPLGLVVARDSDIRSIGDFRGRTMPVDFNSQRIMGSLMNAVYEMGGLTAADINGLPTPTGERAVEDLIAGRVAGTVYTMDAGLLQQAEAEIGVRYISLDNTPENLEIITRHVPGALIGEIQPGDAFPGVDAPVNAFVAPFLLMANQNVDGDAIRTILATLHESKDALVASFAGFSSFDPDAMYQDVGIPYHEAALEYYRETGALD